MGRVFVKLIVSPVPVGTMISGGCQTAPPASQQGPPDLPGAAGGTGAGGGTGGAGGTFCQQNQC